MSISRWNPSTEYTPLEKRLLDRLTKKKLRKLLVFLRKNRMLIFDDKFQAELEGMYRQTGAGKPAIPPALLAMAVLLQGYTKASDEETVELAVVDLRWQMVLGLLGETEPAFSKTTFCEFRARLISTNMDRRLLERTAEIAELTGEYSKRHLPKDLRIGFDSKPLKGAGRVEDTINLLAHAARNVVKCAASALECEVDEICKLAGIELLLAPSVKAGLDLEWHEPAQKEQAIKTLHKQIQSLESWLESTLGGKLSRPLMKEKMDTLHQITEQDLEPDPDDAGGVKITEGVAKDRRISIEDGEMRHGRKSKTKLINGYKVHVANDLDQKVILACAVTPANQAEADAAAVLKEDIEAQGKEINELNIDNGYLSSPVVVELIQQGKKVICRPRKVNNGPFYSKHDFNINLETMKITCPGGAEKEFNLGKVVKFPRKTCFLCRCRSECTKANLKSGRSVSIAKDEKLQQDLRAKSKTPEGRETLRKRTGVEHVLSHVGRRQGNRARYRGARKNLFDTRRCAAIFNLETAHRNQIKAEETVDNAA